jgi:uncharacterized protein (DUF58 family)
MLAYTVNIIRNGFLTNRFFVVVGVLAALCAAGFIAPILFRAVWIALLLFGVCVAADIGFIMQSTGSIRLEREVVSILPLGDPSEVRLEMASSFPYDLSASLIDEWPVEFQQRDFRVDFQLAAGRPRTLAYTIRPVSRGVYRFGKTNLFVRSALGLYQYRHVFDTEREVAVYPSVLQMKRHELAAIRNVVQFHGVKKLRRLGHSYEFEQIKNYVIGDDYRSVNWKATGRKGELMVNQYGDERSQQIYSVIDKSRVMRLPFNGLSLMDHAVNTTLVISNIALRKHDKAGLVTFSDKMGSIIKADNRANQLRRITETLYREKASNLEANYQLLYTICQRMIGHRSLIILYTNFESDHSLDRIIPLLRRINRLHLLLVVFFENSEMSEYAAAGSSDILDIYTRTMAGKFQLDKKMMIKRLQRFGIQTLLTRPEELSVNTVNKYLEFKSRGLI